MIWMGRHASIIFRTRPANFPFPINSFLWQSLTFSQGGSPTKYISFIEWTLVTIHLGYTIIIWVITLVIHCFKTLRRVTWGPVMTNNWRIRITMRRIVLSSTMVRRVNSRWTIR
jgi:hypothetical protein